MGSNPPLSAMKVPEDWPRPKEGKLLAVCKAGYGKGRWFVIDHTGRVLTQRELLYAARMVNQHNRL